MSGCIQLIYLSLMKIYFLNTTCRKNIIAINKNLNLQLISIKLLGQLNFKMSFFSNRKFTVIFVK